MEHRIENPDAMQKFMVAGNARFTLVSEKTGNRFTYRIRTKESSHNPNEKVSFCQVLTGPNNGADYAYLGLLRQTPKGLTLQKTAKSRIGDTAPSRLALDWFLRHLGNAQVQFWHVGKCGRCARDLTVPESIESGFGPECINHV